MWLQTAIFPSVIEHHNGLSALADFCQILSIPLAIWLGLRGVRKKVGGACNLSKKALLLVIGTASSAEDTLQKKNLKSPSVAGHSQLPRRIFTDDCLTV
jgi:hypothetical protein